MILALAASACSHGSPALSSAYPRGATPLDGEIATVECVPFARVVSGLQLYGNAADWWWKADGLYDRSSTPAVGSVLVLRRSSRLAQGHVGVVTAIEGDREIRVTQANWVHHRVFADMPVIDVSAGNDWTLVRVWWPPTGQMGAAAYPAYGFILPDQPRSRDSLAVATGSAIRMAGGAY